MKTEKKTQAEARDIVDELVYFALVDNMKRKPGELVQRLSQHDREILEQLSSDDLSNVRWPPSQSRN